MLCTSGALCQAAGTLQAFAGTGAAGYAGDGGPASKATLN